MLHFTMALGLSLLPSYSVASDQYDQLIRDSWEKRVRHVHWGHAWAQVKQESAFRCDAVSPVGAAGCAQFMPGTWNDMQRLGIVPDSATPFNPRWAFEAQAYYMDYLLRFWKSPRTHESWVNLATASYNAGAGNILKSQKLCNGAVEYGEIMECLPVVTGHHHKETQHYVKNINKYRIERFGK
ncbi:lytic transglycosylase domain-containing protein [Vibrio coralliirubri]|uniref:lytic transglycosylase domain-containing protein n=1 Tax=Vibrio coralliirubri TaxID=1516159 RepID=UPI001F4CDB8A|nr:lytic transglycosylase domain-containing protein [Vibrio coralliirubri]